MPEFYGSAQDVMAYTGVKAESLDMASQHDLEQWLEERLREATSLINAHRNRDYNQEVADGERDEVPNGIHNIATRMVGNLIATAQQRRANPIVRVEDFQIELSDDAILTTALRKELMLFPAKASVRFSVVKKPEEVV